MDVHYPDKPNGYGLLLIPAADGTRLRVTTPSVSRMVRSAVAHFLFSFPACCALAIRCLSSIIGQPSLPLSSSGRRHATRVRFIRSHAKDYGISAERIGAVGYSSGAHLVTMLGVLDGSGNSTDPDPVNRLSASVQCVVANALRADLRSASGATISFVGQPPANAIGGQDPIATEAYRVASPLPMLRAPLRRCS